MLMRILLVFLVCLILLFSILLIDETETGKFSLPIKGEKYYSSNGGGTVLKVVVEDGEMTNIGTIIEP